MKKEKLEKLRKRMIENNPMKRPEVAKKMGNALRERYASGDFVNPFKGKKRPELTKRNLENNPMNNPKTVEKARKSLKEGYESGRLKKWQKGYTKKTHPGLMKISKKSRGREFSKEHKQNIKETHWSKSLKRNQIIEKTKHIGENHPNWLGGKSFEPYDIEFNKKFKKAIRERDGCCMLCNIGFEDLHLLKRKIHIHHVNYDKLISLPQNCISLCNKCHGITNKNREHWTKFFQSLLTERYNYQYNENQEIVLEVKNEIKN